MTSSAGTTPVGGATPISRRWWRLGLLVLVCVVSGLGAVGCAMGWLLMGFMGTAVQPWEPVLYPAGLALCLAVPVLAGRRMLRRPAGRWLAWGTWIVALVAAAGVAVSVLGVSG